MTKDQAILFLFALVMVAAATAMLRKRQEVTSPPIAIYWLLPQGFLVGVVAGAVGAGGGFLIVPALALVAGLQMPQAVATSLAVIALNSLFGFASDLWAGVEVPWTALLPLTTCAFAGLLGGMHWGKHLPAAKLRPAFAVFLLIVAAAIVAVESLSNPV